MEIIAQVLYEAKGPQRNNQIEQSLIVKQYIDESGKNLKRLPGIISKTLNTHSEEGISKDKQRTEPYIFAKDERGRWYLNNIGKQMIK